MWASEDVPIIQPKTKGSGIMVSDFVNAHSGFLQLTDSEHALAKATDPDFPNTARVLLEYGADKEGYWTSEKFMTNSVVHELLSLSIPQMSTPLCGCLIRIAAIVHLLKMPQMQRL